MTSTRARLAALAVLVMTAVPACAVHGLAFDNDHRVRFVSPRDRATVSVPVTLRWRASGLDRTAERGPFFAVFVDRAPIKPGQTLRAVADDACNRTRGCPDLKYLRDRYVFVTTGTSLVLDSVPQRSGQRTGAKQLHEATIVLVDAAGGRIGEYAYTVQFTIEGD
jgi:hypothetical protein